MDPFPEDDPDDLLLLQLDGAQVSRMTARESAGSREEMPPSGNETCTPRARSRTALNKSENICSTASVDRTLRACEWPAIVYYLPLILNSTGFTRINCVDRSRVFSGT